MFHCSGLLYTYLAKQCIIVRDCDFFCARHMFQDDDSSARYLSNDNLELYIRIVLYHVK